MQVFFVPVKAPTLLLNSTRFIRTPVNVKNTDFVLIWKLLLLIIVVAVINGN